MTEKKEKPTGLALLREPFPANQISKLPKETKAQIDERKRDRNAMVFNCEVCGGHHHKKAVHLDYVGHAALTDRLLDCDPNWTWEPCTLPGLPNPGQGMWITLTVCGVSRIGYGSADGKSGGDAIKEIIGDALRNAAMRFGAALDLWHKGDLHADDDGDDHPESAKQEPQRRAKPTAAITNQQLDEMKALIPNQTALTTQIIVEGWNVSALTELTAEQAAKTINRLKAECRKAAPQRDEILADEVPY